jgi:chemotaxis protein MotB
MSRHPLLLPRTRNARVAGAVLLAATAFGFPGCVSEGRYVQVEQERDLLVARNQQCQGAVEDAKNNGESLAQEKAMLAQEKSSLEAERADLQARLAELKLNEESLGSKLKEREQESQKLKATYDGLVTNLKKEVQAGQVQVEQLRDGLRVNVAQDILFDSGSAELDQNGSEVLTRVATQLKKSPHQILVIGHTDNKPVGPGLVKQYPTNWELGGARASSVVRLFGHTGLPDKRMLAVSMADVKPVATNNTVEGRAKNRRIEIRLRPVED